MGFDLLEGADNTRQCIRVLEGADNTRQCIRVLEGADNTRQCIRVLEGLGHQLGHQPTTVIWDNLGAHHAGDLQEWARPSRGLCLRTCRRTRRSWTRWRGCGPT